MAHGVLRGDGSCGGSVAYHLNPTPDQQICAAKQTVSFRLRSLKQTERCLLCSVLPFWDAQSTVKVELLLPDACDQNVLEFSVHSEKGGTITKIMDTVNVDSRSYERRRGFPLPVRTNVREHKKKLDKLESPGTLK